MSIKIQPIVMPGTSLALDGSALLVLGTGAEREGLGKAAAKPQSKEGPSALLGWRFPSTLACKPTWLEGKGAPFWREAVGSCYAFCPAQ